MAIELSALLWREQPRNPQRSREMSNSSASPSRNLVEFYKNRMLHPDAVRDVNVKSLFKDETVNTNIPSSLPPGSRVYYTGKRISESNPNLIDHLQVEPAITIK